MNNIKVRTKLVIVMVIALIALALCTVISNTSLSGLGNNALDIIENDMRSSYDEQIKAQVDNVISLCQSIYNRYEKGEYTLDEAEKLAADQIRDLRYGNNGYFWVDTYDGTNVVLLGNDTEGTNRMDAVDCISSKHASMFFFFQFLLPLLYPDHCNKLFFLPWSCFWSSHNFLHEFYGYPQW